MKTLNFLFISLIMVAFLAPNVAKAQASVVVEPDEFMVHYEVDGVPVEALVVGEWRVVKNIHEFDDYFRVHIVKTFRGVIVDDVPLPERTLKMDYGKLPIVYTMIITPTGEVTLLNAKSVI